MAKTLNVALQMDPVESIDISGDSSFVMGLEALKRGYSLYHYLPDDLSWVEGTVYAKVRPLDLRREDGNHYTLGAYERRALADMDVVLMRQDPPFDMNYITITHMLDLIHPKPFVVNHPTSVRNAPEKLFVTEFADLMPPTLITRDMDEVLAFREKYQDIVIKPLFGNGGVGVFHLKPGDSNLDSLMELFLSASREAVMVQQFLPDVRAGDKRIILIDGDVAGAINRVPAEGQIRSNMVVGGTPEKTTLTPREEEICARLSARLKELDLIFVGIDVIGGWLTEINVTSPTGLQSINRYENLCIEADLWDAIERKIGA